MHGFDRRRFLELSGAAALAVSLPSAHAASPRRSRAPRKALMYGMIEGELPIAKKLELAKAAGFEGVELDSPPSGHTVEEAVDALKATGMQAAGVVDSVHWSKPLSSPDAAVREAGRTALEGALRDAKRYGTDSVLLVPAIVNVEVSYAEAWERSTAEIRRVLPLAKELRVHVSIENVWNNFLLSPLEAARYVDQLESEWAGWHMDLGNVVLYGWPAQWIATLGKRIRRLHVKDYSRKKLDAEGRWKGFDVELGDGDVDWPAVRKALAAIGYEGWASAEVNGGGLERLKDVAARMERILGG